MDTLSKYASMKRATPMMSSCHHLEAPETGSHTYHADPAMQGTQTEGASRLLRHLAGTLYTSCFATAEYGTLQGLSRKENCQEGWEVQVW